MYFLCVRERKTGSWRASCLSGFTDRPTGLTSTALLWCKAYCLIFSYDHITLHACEYLLLLPFTWSEAHSVWASETDHLTQLYGTLFTCITCNVLKMEDDTSMHVFLLVLHIYNMSQPKLCVCVKYNMTREGDRVLEERQGDYIRQLKVGVRLSVADHLLQMSLYWS